MWYNHSIAFIIPYTASAMTPMSETKPLDTLQKGYLECIGVYWDLFILVRILLC